MSLSSCIVKFGRTFLFGIVHDKKFTSSEVNFPLRVVKKIECTPLTHSMAESFSLQAHLQNIFEEIPNMNVKSTYRDENEEDKESDLLKELYSLVLDENDNVENPNPPEETDYTSPSEKIGEVEESDILDEIDYAFDTNKTMYEKMHQGIYSDADYMPKDVDDLTEFLDDIIDEFSNLRKDHQEYELENMILSLTEYDLNEKEETSYREMTGVGGKTYITLVEKKKKLLAIKSLSQPLFGSPLVMREKLLNAKIERFEKDLQALRSKNQHSDLVSDNAKKQDIRNEGNQIHNEDEIELCDEVSTNNSLSDQVSTIGISTWDSEDEIENDQLREQIEDLEQKIKILQENLKEEQARKEAYLQAMEELEKNILEEQIRREAEAIAIENLKKVLENAQRCNVDDKDYIHELKDKLIVERRHREVDKDNIEKLKETLKEERIHRSVDEAIIEKLKGKWMEEKKLREADLGVYRKKFDSLKYANKKLHAAVSHATLCKNRRSCSICLYVKHSFSEVDDSSENSGVLHQLRGSMKSFRTWLRPSILRTRTPSSESCSTDRDLEHEVCYPSTSSDVRPLSTDSGIGDSDVHRNSRSVWRMSGFWSKPGARESDRVMTRSRVTSSFRNLISRKSMPSL